MCYTMEYVYNRHIFLDSNFRQLFSLLLSLCNMLKLFSTHNTTFKLKS